MVELQSRSLVGQQVQFNELALVPVEQVPVRKLPCRDHASRGVPDDLPRAIDDHGVGQVGTRTTKTVHERVPRFHLCRNTDDRRQVGKAVGKRSGGREDGSDGSARNQLDVNRVGPIRLESENRKIVLLRGLREADGPEVGAVGDRQLRQDGHVRLQLDDPGQRRLAIRVHGQCRTR